MSQSTKSLILAEPLRDCRRCDSALDLDNFCTDPTCPFSEHHQACGAGWLGHPEWFTHVVTAGLHTPCQADLECTCGGKAYQLLGEV